MKGNKRHFILGWEKTRIEMNFQKAVEETFEDGRIPKGNAFKSLRQEAREGQRKLYPPYKMRESEGHVDEKKWKSEVVVAVAAE